MKKKFGLRVAVIAITAALLSQSAFATSGKLSDWTPFEMVKGKKTPITMTDGGVHMEGAGSFAEGAQGMGAQYTKKIDITNFSLEYSVEKFGGLLGKDAGIGHFINFGFHTEKGGIGTGTGFYLSQYQGENDTTLMTYKVVPGQNAAMVNHLNLPGSPATTKVFKINIKCNDKEQKVEVRFNNSYRFQDKNQNMMEYVYQIPYSALNIEELKKSCYFSVQACDVNSDNQAVIESMPTKLSIRKINDVTFAKDEAPASSTEASSETDSSLVSSSQVPVSSQETPAVTSEASSAPASTTSENSSVSSDSGSEGSFPVWAIVVIAVVIVAGAGVIIFFVMKKKNADPSDPAAGSSDSSDQN